MFRAIICGAVFSILLAGCETGHLWSLYSLGFTERDAYIDSLGDARDTLRELQQEVELLSAAELDPDTNKSRELRKQSFHLKSFRRQLKTSRNASGDWLRHWRSAPNKYHTQSYDVNQAVVRIATIESQAQVVIKDFKSLTKLAKTGFFPATEPWLQQAQAWLEHVNQHLDWLESDESGYPIDKPLIF